MIRKQITFILACIIATSCDVSTETNLPEDPNNMTTKSNLVSMDAHPIVFYNVENLFDTKDDPTTTGDDEFSPEGENFWDDERYQLKLNHLVEAMLLANNKTPMFAGFAEIENRSVLEDLCRTSVFKNVNYRITHFDSEDRRGVDCGFIYDADRFVPLLETRLAVRMEDEPHFRTRDILYIKGQVKDGKELHVFVNHWSSRREGEAITEPRRIQAAKVLRAKIDEILNQNAAANIIVMGDFNDTPVDKSLYDVVRAKGQHELQSGDLVNLLIEEQNRELGTSVHRGNWDVLDQLIVSQGLLQGKSGLTIYKNNAFIVRNETLLFTYRNGDQKPSATYGGNQYYGGYSDHLPVYLILESINK